MHCRMQVQKNKSSEEYDDQEEFQDTELSQLFSEEDEVYI